MKDQNNGFSALEMMAVLVVIGILAAMSIPSYIGRIVREQIVSALPIADIAKDPIAMIWKTEQVFPEDNAEADIPSPDKIVNNMISSLQVEHGVIHLTFGNNAHRMIQGKVLSIRPAVVEDEPVVPIAWICGNAPVPDKMAVRGGNKTDIENGYLPLGCRNTKAAK